MISFDHDYLKYNNVPHLNTDRPHTEGSLAEAYFDYIESHPQVYPENQNIEVQASNFSAIEGEHEVLSSYEGVSFPLLTDEAGAITWEFEVEFAGFYRIRIDYYSYEGKSSAIERSVLVNDETPFSGADHVVLQRHWGNQEEIYQDILGNDIRPSQIEIPIWSSYYVKDAMGYVSEDYNFYFNLGINTVTLISLREPLLIDVIALESVIGLPTYEEVSAIYAQMNYQVVNEEPYLLQGEHAIRTTSPTLYPLNDRTSSRTMPSHPEKIMLNTIGGNNWRITGDRITWEFDIETSGLYAISLRVKQRLATGMSVYRNIYINDEIPFKEMQNYPFAQSNDWRMQTLGTKEEAYLFYFEAGRHTLTMEVSLGDYGLLISDLQNTIDNLNRLYREILVYTGPSPDSYRDYDLQNRIPNLVSRLREYQEMLTSIRSALIEISGSKSEKTGILDTVLLQLRDFINRPSIIHRNLGTYVSNISSLGTLVLMLSEQPLEIDYFAFHQPESKLPISRSNFFEGFFYDLRAFIASFTTNYAEVGRRDTGQVNETIEVWLSIGQDQANILRKLIDETFAPQNQIQVDLKLVSSTALLPATLSGRGPDVAIGQDITIPVNYAMRNATYDLSTFADFDLVRERFMENAMVPFYYNEGYYALPEQQIFLMMFYRTDIFEEINLTPPNTWTEMIEMIPSLQKHNLEFYLPVPLTQGSAVVLPPNPIFTTMFYQNDGEIYIDNNQQSGFNEGLGPQVFETWSQFYTDYSFPVEANFVNRFRSGQMPIGIVNYNIYNTLSVFAPEIRGRWNFVAVPGTVYIDEMGNEQIRRETVSTGTASIMLKQTDKPNESWEFLKWWTSTETQVRFGREMEGVIGAAARYPTANVAAMEQLPWTIGELEKLQEQWQWVRGIPEVPGGYMTGRHLDNAFRMVLNQNANPRETLYDYVQMINEEINKKRREFDLD